MIDKAEYQLRAGQATTAQLVVMAFELAAAFIRQALAERADESRFRAQVDKAKNAVMQLILGLDFASPLAQDFYSLYQYVYKILTDAQVKRQTAPAEEALGLLETLLAGWREAASVETAAAPAIAEHAQVYAGLTYQRGGLVEYVVQDESRGYQA